IAAGNEEIPGLLFFHGDIEHDAIRRRTRRCQNLYRFEIAERLETTFAAIDNRPVVSVALADIEFAAEDFVVRFDVAVNLDTLDIDAPAPFDMVRNIDQPPVGAAPAA